MNYLKVLGLILCLLSLTGCIYMNVSIPLDTDLQETDLGSKVGESSAHSVLAMVAWGDAGTQAAAADGNITLLKHADQRILAILGLVYYRQTTVVYGD